MEHSSGSEVALEYLGRVRVRGRHRRRHGGSRGRLESHGGKSGAGAAYIYVRTGSTWSLEQRVQASDAATGDRFGTNVSLRGDLLAVGAPLHDVGGVANAGAGYVFERSTGSWSSLPALTVVGGEAGDQLGGSVAALAGVILLGAPGAGGEGAAYLFDATPAGWTQREGAVLSAPNPLSGDRFGYAAGAAETTVVVGAPQRGTTNGTAVVFEGVR